MTTGKKILIAVAILIVGGAVVAANIYYRRDRGVQVATEAIRARDLEAIVSASGKVQPKRQVNISANTMGKVTRLAVEEGQRVKAGQFLLEIDPRSLAGQLERGEASVAAAQSSLQQGRGRRSMQAKANLDLAKQNLKRQEDLWKDGLTTKENLDRAQNEVAVREADLQVARAGHPDARAADQAGSGQPRHHEVQPQPGDHLVADGRPGHAPQHRGRRDGGGRHDEQRRHRAADDCRHVGARSRGRSGRDRHPERRARPDRQGDDRRGARTASSRATSPRSPTARSRRPPTPRGSGRPPRSRWS